MSLRKPRRLRSSAGSGRRVRSIGRLSMHRSGCTREPCAPLVPSGARIGLESWSLGLEKRYGSSNHDAAAIAKPRGDARGAPGPFLCGRNLLVYTQPVGDTKRVRAPLSTLDAEKHALAGWLRAWTGVSFFGVATPEVPHLSVRVDLGSGAVAGGPQSPKATASTRVSSRSCTHDGTRRASGACFCMITKSQDSEQYRTSKVRRKTRLQRRSTGKMC